MARPGLAKILIADDDRDVCSVLGMLLTRKGHNILEAYDGVDAWNKIERERPDLVLLDIMMPGISGLEICRRIRANDQLERIPVLMISALNEPAEIIEGFQAGASDYITKPFVNAEVLARVAGALREWQLAEIRAKHTVLAHFGEQLNRVINDLERPFRKLLRLTKDLRDICVGYEEHAPVGQGAYQNCMRAYLIVKELQQKRAAVRQKIEKTDSE
jgi:DNA-binding response OmpR family regulator